MISEVPVSSQSCDSNSWILPNSSRVSAGWLGEAEGSPGFREFKSMAEKIQLRWRFFLLRLYTRFSGVCVERRGQEMVLEE